MFALSELIEQMCSHLNALNLKNKNKQQKNSKIKHKCFFFKTFSKFLNVERCAVCDLLSDGGS